MNELSATEIRARIGDFLREHASDFSELPASVLRAYAVLAAMPAAVAGTFETAEDAARAERVLRERDEAFSTVMRWERDNAERAKRVRAAFFRWAAKLGQDVLPVLIEMICKEAGNG